MVCFLIDDDVDDREIFAITLAEIDTNIKCLTANDGREGIEKLTADESFIPDYIFLDLNMHRLNGKECLKEIKKIDRLKNTKVIIYSTSSNPQDITETRELKANGYMVKQASLSSLRKKLMEVFDTYNYECVV